MNIESRIVELLSKNDYPLTELSEAAGVSRKTAWRYVTDMHQAGRAHIIDWNRADGKRGPIVAVYRIGGGEDAKRPKAYTKRERSYRYWQKNQAIEKARRAAKSMAGNPFAQLMWASQ
jgi:HTH domain